MFKNIVKLLLPIAIIGLHWYTGWGFILYLLGVLYSITLILFLLGSAVVVHTGKVPNVKLGTGIERTIGYIGSLVYIVYFLFTASYVLASLLIAITIIALVFEAICTKLKDDNV